MNDPPAPRPPRPRGPLAAFVDVRRDEAGAVACLFLLLFCVIFVFWCLKPLRTSSVVKAYGAELYPVFKQGTALVMPLAVWAYSALSDRLRRDRLFYGVLGTFFALTLGFWALLRGVEADWPAVLFYFYVDTYVTVGVAMFWSFLNDASTAERAKRLYGVIGAGGIAGGLAGSAASAGLTEPLGDHLLLVTLPFFAVAALLVRSASRALGPAAGKPESAPTGGRRPAWSEALAGARLVLRSRYLRSIAGIVLLYELVSTHIDYVFATLTDAAFPDREAMAAYQGEVFFWANAGALATQLLAVSWVHRRLGVRAGLFVLPAVLLAGSLGFLAEPLLLAASLLIGAEGALAYSMNQSSKEVLYTPTDRATTYKAKAFIDMFVFRAAKALGGAFLLVYGFVLTDLGLGLPLLGVVNIGLLLAWVGVASTAGRRFRTLEEREARRHGALLRGEPSGV